MSLVWDLCVDYGVGHRVLDDDDNSDETFSLPPPKKIAVHPCAPTDSRKGKEGNQASPTVARGRRGEEDG